MTQIIVVIVAYLIGSIPFGYLIVRGKVGADIRETGSGGTGATNVSRRAGKMAGVVTLVLDALKGGAALLVAAKWTDSDWMITAAAIAVLVKKSASITTTRYIQARSYRSTFMASSRREWMTGEEDEAVDREPEDHEHDGVRPDERERPDGMLRQSRGHLRHAHLHAWDERARSFRLAGRGP